MIEVEMETLEVFDSSLEARTAPELTDYITGRPPFLYSVLSLR